MIKYIAYLILALLCSQAAAHDDKVGKKIKMSAPPQLESKVAEIQKQIENLQLNLR